MFFLVWSHIHLNILICVCVVGVGVFPFKSSRFDRVGGFLSWLLGVGVGSCLVWVGTMVGVVVQ